MRLKQSIAIGSVGVIAAVTLAACGGDDAATTGDTAAADATVLASATNFDAEAHTVTLPLFEGRTAEGAKTYYIISDSSDEADATERGVNFAPKLANALGTDAVQTATDENGTLTFEGTVDFSPENVVEPGADGFPPNTAKAGAVGDAAYSPLVSTDGETVLNASQVANDSGQNDTVVDLDLKGKTVTLDLLEGFSNEQRNFYLHTEGSIELLAGIEASTLAPNLNDAPGLASNDPDSARSAIIPIVNGLREADDPAQRQGLQSALLGEGPPLNVQQELPSSPLYSPLWDVHPAVWTDEATASDQRKRLTSALQISDAIEAGLITSAPDTKAANASLGGLNAAEFISNCPTIAVFSS